MDKNTKGGIVRNILVIKLLGFAEFFINFAPAPVVSVLSYIKREIESFCHEYNIYLIFHLGSRKMYISFVALPLMK